LCSFKYFIYVCFYILCIPCFFCIVYCIVSPFVLSPICIQIYWILLAAGHPVAVYKYLPYTKQRGGLFWLPLGVRGGFAAARQLGLRVRISPATWKPVLCECYVLSCRRLCDGPIPRPEESYRACMWHWMWSGATTALYNYSV